jgi:hypothetical protein
MKPGEVSGACGLFVSSISRSHIAMPSAATRADGACAYSAASLGRDADFFAQ